MNLEQLDAEILRINKEMFRVICSWNYANREAQGNLLDALERRAEELWKLKYELDT